MTTLTAADRLYARNLSLQEASRLEKERIDTVIDRIDKEASALSDIERTGANIAALYRKELASVESLLKELKTKSTKANRPIAYEVKQTSKKQLKQIIAFWEKQDRQTPLVAPEGKGANKPLTLRQVALQCLYNGTPVYDNEQANEMAQQQGLKSGQRVYKLYNKMRRVSDRIGVEGREVIPLIKDIEAVLPHLTESQRKQADNELDTLKLRSL